MDLSQSPEDCIARSTANADLFDLLSLAFAYPEAGFRAALDSGEFAQAVQQALARLPQTDPLSAAGMRLQQALNALQREAHPEELESEYLALFELNQDQPPLHLNAHLYTEGAPDPVSVYQRLLERYRRSGIEPRSGEGVEAPDHLTVQLEFLAFLYRSLGSALNERSHSKTAALEQAIAAFRQEMRWVETWLAELEQRGGHPLYSPLGTLLWSLLQHNTGGDARQDC